MPFIPLLHSGLFRLPLRRGSVFSAVGGALKLDAGLTSAFQLSDNIHCGMFRDFLMPRYGLNFFQACLHNGQMAIFSRRALISALMSS
jgi:hypothetical protein